MTTIVARNKGKETTKTVRKKTPTFVLTLPLHVEHFQAKQLDVRFEIARKIYNACIKELYHRYHLLCQSTEYQRIMKQIRATYREEEKGRYLNQKNRTNQAVSLEHVRRPLWKKNRRFMKSTASMNTAFTHSCSPWRHTSNGTWIRMRKWLYAAG
ncbi:hypothetical protein P9597_00055 [Aneurinibacillus migulanus]|uniref:hypothetical protein n=1 Tax=Aneurinibacillus migulanus TaxID=47500 RepID=UPI002E1B794D|nr:hypothetical protein [Aneurinibacillus migulanus]